MWTFPDLASGAEAVRALAQSGLFPVNCRLLDAGEALLSARISPGAGALLVLGFESADHPVDQPMSRALELCHDHGGTLPEAPTSTDSGAPGGAEGTGGRSAAGRDGAAGEWRHSFLRAPYTRDALVRLGVICETFETACTWDRFPGLLAAVTSAVEDALAPHLWCGMVTCRVTHAYPDGVAPYFSVLAPGRLRAASWPSGPRSRPRPTDALAGRGRHDHPPPRRGPRPPSLVRQATTGSLRLRPACRQVGTRPGRHPQPWRPRRPLTRPGVAGARGARRRAAGAARPAR